MKSSTLMVGFFHPTAGNFVTDRLNSVFEIPGGHVEDDDASIFEAVKREVKEEAKLSVTRVVGQIESFSYASQKKVEKSAGEEVSERVSLQLNFVCMTDKETYCVDPEAHSEGMWASKEEVKVLNVTDAMKKVTECAFQYSEGL